MMPCYKENYLVKLEQLVNVNYIFVVYLKVTGNNLDIYIETNESE